MTIPIAIWQMPGEGREEEGASHHYLDNGHSNDRLGNGGGGAGALQLRVPKGKDFDAKM